MGYLPMDLDSAYALIRGRALSLGTGIASVSIVDNKMEVTTNDGHVIYIEYDKPYDGNRVTHMFVSPSGNELVIRQRVKGRVNEHRVLLPEIKGIVEEIKCTATVGGCMTGTLYRPGTSFEKICRDILTGAPWKPTISMLSTSPEYQNGEFLMDKSIPTPLGNVILDITTSLAEESIEHGFEINHTWIQTGNETQDLDVNEPTGDNYQINKDFSFMSNPNQDYDIKALTSDNKNHVAQSLIHCRWIWPLCIGVYDGTDELTCIKKQLDKPVDQPDGLTPEQRLNYLSINYFDSNLVTDCHYPSQDPTVTETHSWLSHYAVEKNSVTHIMDKEITGKLVIAYPRSYGLLKSITINGGPNLLDYDNWEVAQGVHKELIPRNSIWLETWDCDEWDVYIQADPYEYGYNDIIEIQ